MRGETDLSVTGEGGLPLLAFRCLACSTRFIGSLPPDPQYPCPTCGVVDLPEQPARYLIRQAEGYMWARHLVNERRPQRTLCGLRSIAPLYGETEGEGWKARAGSRYEIWCDGCDRILSLPS